MHSEVGSADDLARSSLADDDSPEALFELGECFGETEDGHDLGGDGDVEARFARKGVGSAAEADDDLAQGPIVHVDDPVPDDPTGVDAARVAMVDIVVEGGGEEIVGGGDGVDIPGEVQVDIFHRRDLGIAAASTAAFHAEAGAQRRLAQTDGGALAYMVERVAQTDGGGGLTLAGRRRVDCGYQHQLALVVLGLCGLWLSFQMLAEIL